MFYVQYVEHILDIHYIYTYVNVVLQICILKFHLKPSYSANRSKYKCILVSIIPLLWVMGQTFHVMKSIYTYQLLFLILA